MFRNIDSSPIIIILLLVLFDAAVVTTTTGAGKGVEQWQRRALRIVSMAEKSISRGPDYLLLDAPPPGGSFLFLERRQVFGNSGWAGEEH